jgi:putative cell wall-binding protein
MGHAQQRNRRSVGGWLAALAALAMMIGLLPLAAPVDAQVGDPTAVEVNRLAGAQRYQTARVIAEDQWTTSSTVVIAKAEDWPDALAGNYFAGQFRSPILLISQREVQADTLQALDDLNATEVLLLGGTRAIEPGNVTTLERAGYKVRRFAGATRFETAARVALGAVDAQGNYAVGTWQGQRTAIVATGERFADALVAGTASWSGRFPLLLTPIDALHPAAAAALDELEIRRVIVPGGEGAVAAEVVEQIEARGISVRRVFGPTRWETATAFADFTIANFGFNARTVDVATGADFPDALTMGPHAARLRAPLILTNGRDETPVTSVQQWLSGRACETVRLNIAGGFAAVRQSNEAALVAAANACGPTVVGVDPAASGVVADDEPTTTVTVTVVDLEGAPVAGLSPGAITYIDEAGSAQSLAGEEWVAFTEDAAGVYTATINPEVVLEATQTTTGWTVRDVVIEPTVVLRSAGPVVEPAAVDPEASSVEADDEPTTTVTVTVVDVDDEPVVDLDAADITYTDEDGSAQSLADEEWVGFTEDAAGVYTATIDSELVPAGTWTTTDWTVRDVVVEEEVVLSSAGAVDPTAVDPDASGVDGDDAPNTEITVTVVNRAGEPVTGLTEEDIGYTDAIGVTDTLAGFGYWDDFDEVDATGVYTAVVDPEVLQAGEYTTTDWTVDGEVIEATVLVRSTGPADDDPEDPGDPDEPGDPDDPEGDGANGAGAALAGLLARLR